MPIVKAMFESTTSLASDRLAPPRGGHAPQGCAGSHGVRSGCTVPPARGVCAAGSSILLALLLAGGCESAPKTGADPAGAAATPASKEAAPRPQWIQTEAGSARTRGANRGTNQGTPQAATQAANQTASQGASPQRLTADSPRGTRGTASAADGVPARTTTRGAVRPQVGLADPEMNEDFRPVQVGTPSATAPARGAPAQAEAQQGGNWSILLMSFTEEDHRAMAEAAHRAMVQRFPLVQQAFVRTNSRGSMVLLGRFTGPSDPAAQAELRKLKEFGQGGQRPFAKAMLVRTGASPPRGPIGPYDLRTVRREYPNGTLYTLQVAAWASLGSRELTMEQITRSAEAHARQLRGQGYLAFYHHDYDTETSTVTVGVFGPDAYDSRSTLFSPDVEDAMRSFPKSLLNGEEVLIPADPKRPGSKPVPQSSRLVEIPRF